MIGGSKSRVERMYGWSVSPKVWMWFHLFNVLKWCLLFVPGMLIWRESVPFLMYVSLDTALTGSLAGFGAALAGRKADRNDPL